MIWQSKMINLKANLQNCNKSWKRIFHLFRYPKKRTSKPHGKSNRTIKSCKIARNRKTIRQIS